MTEGEKKILKDKGLKQGKDFLIQSAQSFLKSTKGKELIAKTEDIPIGDVKKITNNPKKFEKYEPVIKVYTTEGRIYDKQTNKPIPGVKVEPRFTLYPLKYEKKTRIIEIPDPSGEKNKLGIVNKIEQTETYKSWSEDDDKPTFIRTDSEGRFKLQFGVPVIPALNDKILGLKPRIFYLEEEGYVPASQSIIDGNNEVAQELPIFSLLNLEEAAKEAKIVAEKELIKKALIVAGFFVDAADSALNALRNMILGFAGVVQTKLFPLAFQIYVLFGVAKEEQALQGEATCPNNDVLKSIIKKRNSVVRQINNMYAVIIANTALAGVFFYLSLQLQSFKGVISSFAFPLSVPPGVGVPYSLVAALEDIKETLEKLTNVSSDIKKALLISLVFLIISLVIILRYLKTIDQLIEGCSSEGETSMVEISSGLLELQKQDEDQGEPIVTNVNGFTMSVEVVDKSNVDEYFRRQAIAKNSQGITILKGEPSFSGTDQILIDELVFYIKQNNLKAD